MTWPRRARRARRAQCGAVVATVALVLVLAQQPVRGAFNGTTDSTGNQIRTATTFCTTPGSTSLNAVADSWANEQNRPWTGGGDDYYNLVTSQAGVDQRTFVRFSTLPPIPSGCALASAMLRLYTDGPDANRTLDAYLADPAAPLWTETTLSWDTQPAGVGTPAAAVTVASNGYVSWDVTALVKTLYTVTDNGFVIRDRYEDSATGYGQQYIARQGGNPPKLDLTWS